MLALQRLWNFWWLAPHIRQQSFATQDEQSKAAAQLEGGRRGRWRRRALASWPQYSCGGVERCLARRLSRSAPTASQHSLRRGWVPGSSINGDDDDAAAQDGPEDKAGRREGRGRRQPGAYQCLGRRTAAGSGSGRTGEPVADGVTPAAAAAAAATAAAAGAATTGYH